jgi:hypothetical protein
MSRRVDLVTDRASTHQQDATQVRVLGTGYAWYERGTSLPTVDKLDALLHAVSPDRDFVLHPSPIWECISSRGIRR